jgi:hypothetical protein
MERAIAKIARVSANYDAGRQGGLRQFTENKDMSPAVLRDLLSRTFSLKLGTNLLLLERYYDAHFRALSVAAVWPRCTDKRETKALVYFLDKSGDGKVDGSEFLNEFLKLGRLEKKRRLGSKAKKDQRAKEREVCESFVFRASSDAYSHSLEQSSAIE